jgi:hypothetical protein
LLPLDAVPRVRPSDRAHLALVTESLLREERAPNLGCE